MLYKQLPTFSTASVLQLEALHKRHKYQRSAFHWNLSATQVDIITSISTTNGQIEWSYVVLFNVNMSVNIVLSKVSVEEDIDSQTGYIDWLFCRFS
jgi:hypothetical protein